MIITVIIFVVVAVVMWFLWPVTQPPARRKYHHYSYRVGRPRRKARFIMLELSCTNEEKVPVKITPITTTGRPSKIQSASLVVTAQNGYGTVELIDDSSFYVVSGDDPGDTEYLVCGDADLGEGVTTISDIVLLRVAGASAANLGLSAGAAVPK